MNDSRFHIRPMRRSELDLAVEWAAAEGWNPGLRDATCFHAADPDGFLLGLIDNNPVGSISVVRYGRAFGFLGFYIVKPDHRKQGYGIRLWNAGMEKLANRTVGLDGVVDQQSNYRKSGFVLAHNNLRYSGIADGRTGDFEGLVELSETEWQAVLAYDQPFFAGPRESFLHCWLRQSGHRAFGVINADRLSGYGVIRPCREGYKIGPLFADSAEIAQRLFGALLAGTPSGTPVSLDVPAVNSAAIELAEQYGMTISFETARMYRGPAPDLPLERIFGITTFELG